MDRSLNIVEQALIASFEAEELKKLDLQKKKMTEEFLQRSVVPLEPVGEFEIPSQNISLDKARNTGIGIGVFSGCDSELRFGVIMYSCRAKKYNFNYISNMSGLEIVKSFNLTELAPFNQMYCGALYIHGLYVNDPENCLLKNDNTIVLGFNKNTQGEIFTFFMKVENGLPNLFREPVDVLLGGDIVQLH